MSSKVSAVTTSSGEPEDVLRSVFASESMFEPEPGLQPDSIAKKEALSIANCVDIEQDGKEQEHNRHQAFRNHVNRATIMLFWIISAGLLIGIAAFAWHMVTPEKWHYLSQAQLDKLQTVLGSAILSSAFTGYVNRRMS
jgi:hypothetical protein